jgi:hypothetical protein
MNGKNMTGMPKEAMTVPATTRSEPTASRSLDVRLALSSAGRKGIVKPF